MDFECYLKAGKIAAGVRENVRKKYHVGSTLFEICESVEAQIRSMNGQPAFPVNTSLNEIAAHYTAEPNDATVVREGDVLKIDIGVHIDGYIADTAVTCSDQSRTASQAAEAALDVPCVCKGQKDGSRHRQGVEATITTFGFRPIRTLAAIRSTVTITPASRYQISGRAGLRLRLLQSAFAIEPLVTTRRTGGATRERPRTSGAKV